LTNVIKAIDFFCGAGGLTRGLLDAGVSVVAGIDNDSRIRTTYENNNHPSRFIHADIRDIDIAALRRELEIDVKDPVLYAACTPCQPFSSLNTMYGLDERRSLLLDFALIVEQALPDYIIVENVPTASMDELQPIIQMPLDFLEFDAFQEIASEIVHADLRDTSIILKLFREWQIVEAKEMARVIDGRISTIEKLQRLIDQNALEVPTLHNFLKEFPWVIDPRWTMIDHEVRFSELLRRQFPEPKDLPREE